MKRTINIRINRRTCIGTLIILLSMFAQSCRDNEAMKWVDLRYKADDSYTITADGTQTVNIQVKSTDPWIVYSNHSDWCTISPDKGEASELYDVQITYKPNTALDDRTDTITIKSDYWIGKEVAVIQKGIAYMALEGDQDFFLTKEDNSTRTFQVKSNQKWSASVTEGSGWLSIASGESGESDGEVTVKCTVNKGEKRYGKVVVYDRHGIATAEVACTQDGVQLDPENISIRTGHTAHEITLPVVSNTEWTVTKDDADAEWYSFEQTEFEGTQNLVIRLNANTGSSVLKASFTLSTKVVEGITPVTRTITLKQANEAIAVRHEFDDPNNWGINNGTGMANGDLTCTAARVTRGSFAPGYYSFRIKSMTDDAQSTLFFTYGSNEIRWHLNMSTGKTNYSTSPWTPIIERNKAFDKSLKSYTLGLNLTKSETAGLMKIEWYLDGVLMDSHDNGNGVSFNYADAFIYLGASAGTVVYDWWEYTAPIDWGDE